MNGHDHALFGVASYGAAVLVGHHHYGLDAPDTQTLILGGAVALGASLAADLDEKHSIASQGAGVFGSLTRTVTSMFGGHRTVTHYPIAWIGGLTALCFGLIAGDITGPWLGVLCGVLVAIGFPFVVGPKRRSKLGPLLDVATVGLGVAVYWWTTSQEVSADWWLYAAVPVPYLAHLVGDTLTPSGVPWLWPLTSKSPRLPLFHSGGAFENTVASPALSIACLYVGYQLTTIT